MLNVSVYDDHTGVRYSDLTSASLLCTAQLSHDVDIPIIIQFSWSGPHGVISNSSRETDGVVSEWNDSIEIHSATVNDTGEYTCSLSTASLSNSSFIIPSDTVHQSTTLTIGRCITFTVLIN